MGSREAAPCICSPANLAPKPCAAKHTLAEKRISLLQARHMLLSAQQPIIITCTHCSHHMSTLYIIIHIQRTHRCPQYNDIFVMPLASPLTGQPVLYTHHYHYTLIIVTRFHCCRVHVCHFLITHYQHIIDISMKSKIQLLIHQSTYGCNESVCTELTRRSVARTFHMVRDNCPMSSKGPTHIGSNLRSICFILK